jgi:probable H4MPT-linked C1 transfer pathway protein
MSPTRTWLALDVGGANIKAAHSSGATRIVPFELWKQPQELPRVLKGLAGVLPAFDALALTMTAELCDCYHSKAEGVTDVVGAAMNLAPQERICVWGTDGRFHSVAEVLVEPLRAAAANWLALAEASARLAGPGPGLLVDIGSTTTDLVPLLDGRPIPRGRTDTDRLRTGELVYAGTRRTPVCALAPEVPFRGAPTGLAAELFATTRDVYLLRGAIDEDTTDTRTADVRPATRDAACARLARMVGADPEGFPCDDARDLAQALDEALLARLENAAARACEPIGPPAVVVVAGSGRHVATRLAARLLPGGGRLVDLDTTWGPEASEAGCAHALILLVTDHDARP